MTSSINYMSREPQPLGLEYTDVKDVGEKSFTQLSIRFLPKTTINTLRRKGRFAGGWW